MHGTENCQEKIISSLYSGISYKFSSQQSLTIMKIVQLLAPVAETGVNHRLTAYKIVGHFFGLSYLNISGNNQVGSSFFRISNISIPCPHAQLRGHTVIKHLLKSYGHISDLGVEIALSHRHVEKR